MKKGTFSRTIVFCGLFSAISFILYFLEIPIAPGGFLKIDLSDISALAAGILFGPGAGIAVEFIKNLLDVLVRGFGSTMGFGDLMNFIVGTALVGPLSAILRAFIRKDGNRYLGALLAGICGMVAMVAAGIVGNYFIAPPFFSAVMHMTLTSKALWAEIGAATILNAVKSLLALVLLFPLVGTSWKRLMGNMA